MKLLLYLSIFISIISYSQSEKEIYPTDSLERNNPEYLKAQEMGFDIVGFEITNCEEESFHPLGNRIAEISLNQDTLIYKIQFAKGCCSLIRYHLEIPDSNSINFVFKNAPYGEECFCGYCCFTAILKLFNRSNLNPENFLFDGNEIPFSETPLMKTSSDTTYWQTGEVKTIKKCFYDQIEEYKEYDKKGEIIQWEYYNSRGRLIFHDKKKS